MRLFAFILSALALSSCGSDTAMVEDYNTRELKLPNGRKIRVEVMGDPALANPFH